MAYSLKRFLVKHLVFFVLIAILSDILLVFNSAYFLYHPNLNNFLEFYNACTVLIIGEMVMLLFTLYSEKAMQFENKFFTMLYLTGLTFLYGFFLIIIFTKSFIIGVIFSILIINRFRFAFNQEEYQITPAAIIAGIKLFILFVASITFPLEGDFQLKFPQEFENNIKSYSLEKEGIWGKNPEVPFIVCSIYFFFSTIIDIFESRLFFRIKKNILFKKLKNALLRGRTSDN